MRSARRCQERFAIRFPLAEADGDHLPFRAGSFDLVVSEYGAGPWCEPGRWLAEARRVLRPGGRLVFLTNSVLAALCASGALNRGGSYDGLSQSCDRRAGGDLGRCLAGGLRDRAARRRRPRLSRDSARSGKRAGGAEAETDRVHRDGRLGRPRRPAPRRRWTRRSRG